MKSNIIYFLCKFKFIRNLVIKIILFDTYRQSKSDILRKIFIDYYGIDVGFGSYGGCFNYKNINKNVKIGKYCSFAKDIYYFNANHPIEKFTTHPIIYNKIFKMVNSEKIYRNNLNIGNDVWVGQNSIILSNVRNIGNGAIIAAGSVVTKNIPPYAVVAGVPAKIIKYRFDEKTIQKLEEIKWWDWDEDKIKLAIKNFNDVEELIEWGLKNEQE